MSFRGLTGSLFWLSFAVVQAVFAQCEQARLVPQDGGNLDGFGSTLAVDGETVAINSPEHASLGRENSGVVYVYQRLGGSWVSQQEITPNDIVAGDYFGSCLSLDGSRLLITAPGSDKAYLFENQGGAWMEIAQFTGGPGNNGFANSCALGGDWVVLGAPHTSITSYGHEGRVHLFRNTNGTWTSQQLSYPNDLARDDHFGVRLAIDDNILAVGSESGYGAIYAFEFDGMAWNQTGKLEPQDGARYVGIPWAGFAISGDTIVAGAPYHGGGGDSAGAAYVFRKTAGGWIQEVILTAPDATSADLFGESVDIDGDTIVVGALLEDSGACEGGSVYVFQRVNGIWTPEDRLTAADPHLWYYFGSAVEVAGDVVVVGAPAARNNGIESGDTHVFDLNVPCDGLSESDKCAERVGDTVDYAYEADVLPDDPASGFDWVTLCNPPYCRPSIDSGHLVLQFIIGGEVVYTRYIAAVPDDPPAPPFWAEWRFSTNKRSSYNDYGTAPGEFHLGYNMVGRTIFMSGDRVYGPGSAYGLPLDEFRTIRVETQDGYSFCAWYDGKLLGCGTDGQSGMLSHYFQVYNRGQPYVINRWDYIRYGTQGIGETVVSSNPPSGIVDLRLNPNFDRFTVTFNYPSYVKIDEVDVQSSQTITPVVVKTTRPDNGTPDTVEVVLDRPLAVGTTTQFTFNTGGTPNTVTYTVIETGACCLPNGGCIVNEETDCLALEGVFTPSGDCLPSIACCHADGLCIDVAPACCIGAPSGTLCEGDTDLDRRDGVCGDLCPLDPSKWEPGSCGCGVLDIDSDGDTILDCLDQCPGLDDRIDEDGHGVPDCLEPGLVPAVTTWGLCVVSLMLVILGKLIYGVRPPRPNCPRQT